MTKNHPCYKCILRVACSEHCDNYIDYHREWIRDWVKNGSKSRLYQNAKKNINPSALELIKKALTQSGCVKIHNFNSEKYTIISRDGSIVKSY
jgi:hypothetical protein